MEPVSITPDDMKHLGEKFNYSAAVRVGNLLFCAGQVGRDSDMNVITSSLEDHIVKAWENVEAVLAAAGCTTRNIVEMTTYHVDLQEQLGLFVEIKDRFVPRDMAAPPAWTSIGVSELSLPGQVVEIKVVAAIPE